MKVARSLITIFVVIGFLGISAVPQTAYAQSTVPPQCSGFQLQNPSQATTATNISVAFYKIAGGTGTAAYTFALPDIPPNSSKAFYVPSYAGFSTVPSGMYSLVVSSGAQLNSLVNQRTCSGTPYVVASYNGVSALSTATTVYLPYVLSRSFGQNWSSAIAIQNAGSGDTSVTLEFFKPGSATAVATFTQTVKTGEGWYVDLSTGTYATAALSAFAGAVKVTSTSQPVAAVVNYATGGGDQLLSYNGQIVGSSKLYATQVNKSAYAGVYTSGITVYNPNATATPITVDYIPSGATTPVYTQTVSIPANNVFIQYLGSIPDANLPKGFNGTAVVTVTSGTNKIYGLANMSSASGQAGSMSMVTIEQANSTLFLPQILRNAFGGYQSGWQVVNTSANTLTLSVEYWKDTSTTAPAYTQPVTLNANSAFTQYVGNLTALGDNWNGGVIIKVTGGTGTIVGQANIQAPGSGDTLSIYNGFVPQ